MENTTNKNESNLENTVNEKDVVVEEHHCKGNQTNY